LICLRCGYCCIRCFVVIVNDPDKGIVEGNLIAHKGLDTKCKHLIGDTPGQYSCAIHDKPWYEDTPCFSHGQIESSPDAPCRMGVHILPKTKEVT